MHKNDLLKIRLSWFSLKTKQFINRYFMGVFIVLIFLPGVGISENFDTLLTAICKPFATLSQIDTNFIERQVNLNLLIVVLMVWIQAQKSAIKGGKFTVFLQSLPIKESQKKIINIKMLLLGNHLLWPFIIASYFYIASEHHSTSLEIIRNSFLILLLLSTQYVLMFNRSAFNIFSVVGIGTIFTFQINTEYELYRLTFAFLIIGLFIYFLLLKELTFVIKHPMRLYQLFQQILSKNLYLQILFKSSLASSLFRLSIIIGLMVLFTYACHYWVDNNSELTPYYLTLEALLAYFISGFYVSILDQRNRMKLWLVTLPVKMYFWPVRDIFVIVLISTLMHGFFFFWALGKSELALLFNVFVFHLVLLCLCYPIRVFVIQKQTFITFVVLFIITAITIFNLP
jgi:hypothetical protein